MQKCCNKVNLPQHEVVINIYGSIYFTILRNRVKSHTKSYKSLDTGISIHVYKLHNPTPKIQTISLGHLCVNQHTFGSAGVQYEIDTCTLVYLVTLQFYTELHSFIIKNCTIIYNPKTNIIYKLKRLQLQHDSFDTDKVCHCI